MPSAAPRRGWPPSRWPAARRTGPRGWRHCGPSWRWTWTGPSLTTWNDDPWAGESYSAHTVGVADGDDDLIAAPAGRVHITGEHTAGSWAGLMEGALRSGVRAADEVLATA